MRALLFYEAKKVFSNRFLCFTVLFLLLINAMYIYRNYKTYDDKFNQSSIDAEWAMYKNAEGEITEAKTKALENYLQKLKDKAIAPEELYHSEYWDLTVTGNLLREIQTSKDYIAGNERRLAENAAMTNLQSLSGDKYTIRQGRMIARDYADREISSFYRTKSYEQYFQYDFSSLLLLLILFLASATLFSKEKETGMRPLQISTRSGRETLTISKLGAFALFLFTVSILFWVSDYLLFLWRERLVGATNPVYSMPAYADSPLSTPIVGFVFVTAGYKLLGLLVFSMLACVISSVGKKSATVLLGDLLLLFGSMLLSACSGGIFDYLNLLNPICLLIGRNFYKSFQIVNFFSYPVYSYAAILWGGGCLFFGALLTVGALNNGKGARHAA